MALGPLRLGCPTALENSNGDAPPCGGADGCWKGACGTGNPVGGLGGHGRAYRKGWRDVQGWARETRRAHENLLPVGSDGAPDASNLARQRTARSG